ncbi:MAG: hypothetical protein Q9184_004162 [Pyrenodesmia sp. 2 TL-2023]
MALEKPVVLESTHPEGMHRHSFQPNTEVSASTDLFTPLPVKLPDSHPDDNRPDDDHREEKTSECRTPPKGLWQSWWKGYRPQVNQFIRKRIATAVETRHLREASMTVGSAKRRFVEGDNGDRGGKRIRTWDDMAVAA